MCLVGDVIVIVLHILFYYMSAFYVCKFWAYDVQSFVSFTSVIY